jgi:hypothetical protein
MMPRITLSNLYKNGKCRFCGVAPNEKHGNYYHGAGDMFGYNILNIEYEDVKN